MELKVIKKFNGKVEGKTLCPGDTIVTTDIERVNALVGRNLCVIVALDNPTTETPLTEDKDAPEEQPDPKKGRGKSNKENE